MKFDDLMILGFCYGELNIIQFNTIYKNVLKHFAKIKIKKK